MTNWWVPIPKSPTDDQPAYGDPHRETITVTAPMPPDPFGPMFNFGPQPKAPPKGEGGGGRGGDVPSPINPFGEKPPGEVDEARVEILTDLDDPRSRWTRFWDWMAKNFHFSMGGNPLQKLLALLASGMSLAEALKEVENEKPPTGGAGGGGGGGGGKGGPVPPPPPLSGPGSYQGLNFKPNFMAWNPGGAPSMGGIAGPSSLGGKPVAPPPPVKKKKKRG